MIYLEERNILGISLLDLLYFLFVFRIRFRIYFESAQVLQVWYETQEGRKLGRPPAGSEQLETS